MSVHESDQGEEQDDWLADLYYRCDVSNNATDNPIGLDEFKALVTAHEQQAVRAARINEIKWALKRPHGGQAGANELEERLAELSPEPRKRMEITKGEPQATSPEDLDIEIESEEAES